MPKMLKYILSISLLASCINSFSQQTNEEEKKKTPFEPGIAVGLNVGTFITPFFEPERIGMEATGRIKFNRKWFAVGELGYENVSFDKESYNYDSNGSFLRLGIDYNIFKVEETGNNDNIILGFRYGFGVADYKSDRFTVTDGYWGDYLGSIGSGTSTAHWGEFVFGLRSEIFKNFYMGWSARFRLLALTNNTQQLEPYAIPGYGKNDNRTNVGFTYNLEYYLPLKKKK
nr:DUF6048 family protein [uncultured Carboxylicivirga sp.]